MRPARTPGLCMTIQTGRQLLLQSDNGRGIGVPLGERVIDMCPARLRIPAGTILHATHGLRLLRRRMEKKCEQ
jgi:hypothetical protein